jgi:hypothetical protein
MATYIYDYHDERGEFHAYVRDEAGNIIWEVHYPEYLEDDDTGELLEGSTIFEDGYLKNADDLEGLYYYLRDFGAIEEDDEVVKLEDYEKRQDAKDSLLDFAIPNWAMSAIVNGDTSGLEDEDIQKIDAFENRLVKLYGNANLMLGDIDGEDNLGLTMGNDIEENAMTECYRMYLRPTKSYEDGGALMDGQYGYGTSYLAKGGALEDKIKKKLGENFELPIEMAVYVPSTEKAKQIFSKREYASRIDEVRSYLANLFGGYSSEGIDGGYVSDEKGLIQEDVTKVTAFSTKENFEQKLETLITQIKKWCGAWGQESMGFEFEGDLFYISKDGKFMDGGNIPEGFHMMPDGTIMPDSAHLDGGGEVDDDEDEDKEQEHLEYVSEETNIPIDVLKEYANNKGIKIEDLDTDLGYQGSFSDEEAFAQHCANEGLVSNLSYYLEMYPTDKRILIGELTDNYVNDLSDEEILSQSSYEDDAEKLKEAEANLSIQEEELQNLIDEKQDLIDSQDVESMRESDREEMDRALEEFDQKIEDVEATISDTKDDIRDKGDYDDIIERAREEVRDNYYDDLKDRLDKDAVGYFVDELGYDESDLVDKNGFYVDTSALARDLGHDFDFIEYEGEVYVFSSYYKYGGSIDLGSSFDKFKKSLNILPQQIQSQISDNDALRMAIDSVGDAWEDLTDIERNLIVKSFKEGYNKGSYAKGGQFKVDPKYTHFAVGKRDGKIVTGWEYKDLDKESIKYYTKVDLMDMDFKPSDFRILTAKYLKAQGVDPFNWDNWRKHGDNYYAHGGSVEEGNLEMLKNQAKEFKHHAEELGEVLDKKPRVDAWVVAKAERATSDLSDITHYLDGQEDGESFEDGGVTPKVFEKVKITIRDVDMGGDVIYKNDHWINKKSLDEKSSSDIGKYILNKYGLDYGNTYKFSLKRTGETREKMARGGEIKLGDRFVKSSYYNDIYYTILSVNKSRKIAKVKIEYQVQSQGMYRGDFHRVKEVEISLDKINKNISSNVWRKIGGYSKGGSLGQGQGYKREYQDDILYELFYDKSNANYDKFYKLAKNKGYTDYKIDKWYEHRNDEEEKMARGGKTKLEGWDKNNSIFAYAYAKDRQVKHDGTFEQFKKSYFNEVPEEGHYNDKVLRYAYDELNKKKGYARGGELLSDVDMYVKIHGYYPMEVMAMRGDGMGTSIVRNEAHNFELSGVDSRKAEEMGYEFDYDQKGWVEVDEDDDDFSKGGSIDDLDEIKKGDYVNFGEYGNFYVVDTDYLIDGTHFWVTRDKENRTNSQAPGYTILKGDAQYIIEKYSNDDDFAKGGATKKEKADNSDLLRYANSGEQLKVLKDIIPVLNKKGIKLTYGTSIGKSPQTIIFDKDYQDNILYISGRGWQGENSYYGEDFNSADDLKYVIENPSDDDDYAKGGKLSSFFSKAKDYTKKQIKDKKRKIALEVIDSTKDKVSNNKQKMLLKSAEQIVEDKYARGGATFDDKKINEKLAIANKLISQGKVMKDIDEGIEVKYLPIKYNSKGSLEITIQTKENGSFKTYHKYQVSKSDEDYGEETRIEALNRIINELKSSKVELLEKGGKTKWIQEAIQKPGALRETAKRKGLIEGEEKLSKADLKKLEKVGGKTGQRARLAATLKGLGKKKKMVKGGETKFINLSTRKGQSEVEKYTNQGWGIKFQNDKFAILERGGKKKN